MSEGVLQYRHRFIDFDVAVFTGLHAEHIESHGSIEKYRAAKVRFFQDIRRFSNKKPKHFIVNSNNVHTPHFTNVIDDNDIVRYGKYSGKLKLVGDFNRENAAAAAAVAKAIGIKENIIEKALAEFSEIPGRMEFVQKTPFAVVVDYAHTPDSLDAVYGTLTKIKPKNSKMICVLGSAGGGRDKWKRPKLGAIADRYCEEIILTNEDPFDENPAAIISDVKSGIPLNRKNVHEIVSRDDAITKAISSASLGDVVIITGYPTLEDARESTRLGAAEYIEKPFTPDFMLNVAKKVFDTRGWILRQAFIDEFRDYVTPLRDRENPVIFYKEGTWARPAKEGLWEIGCDLR